MKRRHHSPEQIIRKLREAERMLGEGKTIPEAAKELGISEQTYHRWRNQYGGMKADDAKRLKELERENRQLKAIVARPGAREPCVEGDRQGTDESQARAGIFRVSNCQELWIDRMRIVRRRPSRPASWRRRR